MSLACFGLTTEVVQGQCRDWQCWLDGVGCLCTVLLHVYVSLVVVFVHLLQALFPVSAGRQTLADF